MFARKNSATAKKYGKQDFLYKRTVITLKLLKFVTQLQENHNQQRCQLELDSAIFEFRIFLSDLTQIYIQSTKKNHKNVCIKLLLEQCQISKQLLLKLNLLYGFAGSGDYWVVHFGST